MIAADEGVTAARSQKALAIANGKRDLNVTFDYTHTNGINSGAFYFNIDLPIFDRNQGEIARTGYAIAQAQQQATEASEQAMSASSTLTPTSIRTTKSSSSIARAMRTKPKSRATSANILTSAGPPACWIFWTPSGAIAPTSLPTGRRLRVI